MQLNKMFLHILIVTLFLVPAQGQAMFKALFRTTGYTLGFGAGMGTLSSLYVLREAMAKEQSGLSDEEKRARHDRLEKEAERIMHKYADKIQEIKPEQIITIPVAGWAVALMTPGLTPVAVGVLTAAINFGYLMDKKLVGDESMREDAMIMAQYAAEHFGIREEFNKRKNDPWN
ncbi:MAG: hypothetical protein WC707_05355 [Candidatus Babeliaceae bacterium]|jgi:hypothetical protein